MDTMLYSLTKWHYIIFGILIFFGLLIEGEKIYWQYWNIIPLTVETPIKILNPNKQVCQGGVLFYEVKYDKKMNLPVTIKRQIVNSYVITYAPSEPPLKKLGPDKLVGQLHIPNSAEIGDWDLRWEASYEGKYGRYLFVKTNSEIFWVVKCK